MNINSIVTTNNVYPLTVTGSYVPVLSTLGLNFITVLNEYDLQFLQSDHPPPRHHHEPRTVYKKLTKHTHFHHPC